MNRIPCSSRLDWRKKVQSQGLLYHTNDDQTRYWDESVYYTLTVQEVEKLERAANELHQLFLEACDKVIRENRFAELGIPAKFHRFIQTSWEREDWEVYGRFDFAMGDGEPKMLEYNADTPTGLLEAAIIQWYWKTDQHPKNDQFNSIHENLVKRWQEIGERGQFSINAPLYLTCVEGSVEDRMTCGYMAEAAEQAGFIKTEFVLVNDIGWHGNKHLFIDELDRPISQIFKLYPWEWMVQEPYGEYLLENPWRTVEPAWKLILASKALLLILEEIAPDHPNLLPVAREARWDNYVKKPIFGREGKNVSIHVGGNNWQSSGDFGGEGYIYQKYSPLHWEAEHFSQAGVWMIGPKACGLGIREDKRSILQNTSRFIPHFIEG